MPANGLVARAQVSCDFFLVPFPLISNILNIFILNLDSHANNCTQSPCERSSLAISSRCLTIMVYSTKTIFLLAPVTVDNPRNDKIKYAPIRLALVTVLGQMQNKLDINHETNHLRSLLPSRLNEGRKCVSPLFSIRWWKQTSSPEIAHRDP